MTMTFHLPAGLSPDIARDLERSCLTGGPDNMPYTCDVVLTPRSLSATKGNDESGYLVAPWSIESFGKLMGTSATLMDDREYHLLSELTRGKINQLRNQAADWSIGGLLMPDELRNAIHQAVILFGKGVCNDQPEETLRCCQQALAAAYTNAAHLVQLYSRQVFDIRHQRQPRLDSTLSTRLDSSIHQTQIADAVRATFNRVSIPMSWHVVEAEEATYNWDAADILLEWAEGNELDVTGGPLVDFSSSQLPAWLWLWERDLPNMATFMCRFVESTVRRYRARIRRWQLTAGSNWANVLGLTEEELMGLTFRLGEAARQVDPSLELVLGISQPWGDYMVSFERTSPFIFADNLIRSGLNLAAINLEIVMGVNQRGSYCRDALELSRLLDLYALLGVPLHVTLGYPSSPLSDPEGDPELSTGAGYWQSGFSPETQLAWAESLATLAMCKPFVQGVHWAHLSDNENHVFPNCGLIDRVGTAKPTMQFLRSLRETHLT